MFLRGIAFFCLFCKILLRVIMTPPARHQHPHDANNPQVGHWGNCEPKWWPQFHPHPLSWGLPKEGRKQGLHRGGLPQPSPASPRGPRGSRKGPGESRPTEHQGPRARKPGGAQNCHGQLLTLVSQSSFIRQTRSQARCTSSCRRVREDLGYCTKCVPWLAMAIWYLQRR